MISSHQRNRSLILYIVSEKLIILHFLKMDWFVSHIFRTNRISIVKSLRNWNRSWIIMMKVLIKSINVVSCQLPIKIYNIFRCRPSIIIYLKTLSDKLLVIFTNFYIWIKKLVNRTRHYLFVQNIIVFIFPRSLTINKLKCYHTNCPYITFVWITIELKGFWWHVEWRPNIIIELLWAFIRFDCESEVC